MKRLISVIFAYLLFIILFLGVEAKADTDDYSCFVEIVMDTGKLLVDFTEEEKNYYLNKYLEEKYYFGFDIKYIEYNVNASYISATLYNFNNKGDTAISYDIVVEIETANKISYKYSDTLSISRTSTKNNLKGEIANKASFEFSNTTENSKKKKETIKIDVEAQSRCIVYLIGSLSVTNAIVYYYCGTAVTQFFFAEIVTIKSQYYKIEKESI